MRTTPRKKPMKVPSSVVNMLSLIPGKDEEGQGPVRLSYLTVMVSTGMVPLRPTKPPTPPLKKTTY